VLCAPRMPDSAEDPPASETAANAVDVGGGAGEAEDGVSDGGARNRAQSQVGVPPEFHARD